MLHLKKYFTEGLIQLAILLSLCGVRVDVGLEPYLPPSWYDAIMGPTSALTQTQFHNLRNRLDEGSDLHLKNVDLDKFFTTRRLLGWVRSLDRLQVPQAEVETWLVQREPDPLPLARPEQSPLLERNTNGMERDRGVPLLEHTPQFGNVQEEVEDEDKEEEHHQLLHDGGEVEVEEEEEEEGGESTLNEDQTSFSLQECLRLLEENFPSDRRSLSSPLVSTDSLDLEFQWQDLFDIMEPENTDVDMTSFDQAPPPRCFGTTGDLCEALNQHQRHLSEEHGPTNTQHGFLWSPSRPDPSPLLPLTPSADLDDHSSTFGSGGFQKNLNLNAFQSPPDHMDFLEEGSSDKSTSPGDRPGPHHTLYPDEGLTGFDVNFQMRPLTPPSPSSSLEGSEMTQDLVGSFLIDEENVGEDYDLPGRLGDLLDEASLLEEIRVLDLALEGGFSPEMAARLEEEGYLTSDGNNRDSDPPVCERAVGEDRSQSQTLDQDAGNEADSDSGLSLDFSHSPASPSPSYRSRTSSSSSSSSLASSSSYTSGEESPVSGDVDEENEEGVVGSDMELEVTIKQEEVEEEVMGAVGGEYPGDVKKLFPVNCGDHMGLNDFPWQEQVDHDHTYNQPRSSTFPSSPQPHIPTKHSKSSPRPPAARRHHFSTSRSISESKMWSRDERRAKSLKLPFSNELIVHLPVEEFNDLLTGYRLTEEQLCLVRDIRRRGKNKIAAQNCRKRKLDGLMALDDEVSALRRRRTRLMREKQESLRNLQEMKRRLKVLYQEVFSQLRDEEGRQLDSSEFFLNFASDGSVAVDSLQQQAWMPGRGGRTGKKQRSKKK